MNGGAAGTTLSEAQRRRLVAVARQQNLPVGWLAERRSGGHYVIYSPAGVHWKQVSISTSAQTLCFVLHDC